MKTMAAIHKHKQTIHSHDSNTHKLNTTNQIIQYNHVLVQTIKLMYMYV